MKPPSSPAVISRIHGGLGNQLFEYAAGYALARRLGVAHKVDTRVFAEAGERPLALRDFKLSLAEASPEELRETTPQWGPWWRNKYILWSHRLTPFHRRRWVREESFDFDARLFTVRPPVYLDGWWQSEKYFAASAGEIRQMFRLARAPTARTEALGAELASRPTVALHVRRGDYVQHPGYAQFHGVCPVEYYRRALAWLRERAPSTSLVAFSDDPVWARENLCNDGSVRLIEATPGHTAIEDFYLLGCCTHFVIANSSFSWWPAWLSESPCKLVVAPRRWFLGRDVRPEDRFPSGWHLIDA